jgi:nitrate reductase NapAB chaperone NapD
MNTHTHTHTHTHTQTNRQMQEITVCSINLTRINAKIIVVMSPPRFIQKPIVIIESLQGIVEVIADMFLMTFTKSPRH